MPAGRPKPVTPSSEGFVYGPADKTYSVSDIPDMKARIANNPGLAGMLQPLIDRLEAGDFDTPNLPKDKKLPGSTNTDTTVPGGMSQEDIDAAIQKALGEYAPNLEEYAKAGDVESAIQKALGEYAPEGPDLGEYAKTGDTQAAIEAALAGYTPEGPDLGGYSTTGEMEAAIKAALAGYTPEYTPAEADLSEYAKTGDTQAAIEAALAGYAPDLSEYAKTGDFDFSDVMTAADAKELFQGMDTGQIEANVLQKMGLPDFLTNQQVQDAINTALGETDSLSEDDVLRMIQESTGADVDLSNYMSKSDIDQAIQASASKFLTPEMIQQMINNAQLQGMSEEDIFAMIQEVSGGTMSDDDIMNAIAEAQEGQYTSLMDEVNKLIADSLAQGMSEEEILTLIQEQYGEQMTDDDIMNAIAEAQQGQYDTMMDEVNTLIAEALNQGLSAEQITAIIKDQYGEQMTDDQILDAIAAVQEGVPTIETIEQMIAQALEDGVSPEDIAIMIGDYVGDSGLLSADEIATMISDAIAGIETTPAEDALTAESVQQMIDAAMAQGMSTEQVEAMLAESGYMGEEGIQGLIGSALEGALGQGGSINQAIQAALAATGDTGTGVPEMDFTQPYTPGSFPTSPYGEVDPYSLMGTNQFAGTTPFSGASTTGATSSTGLGTLNFGDPAQYNFDIPTTLGVDLYPSGIDPRYFEPVPEPQVPEPVTLPPHKDPLKKEPYDPFTTNDIIIGDLAG